MNPEKDNNSLKSGNVGRKPKVIHVIWWIPHYRGPIFRRLSQNPHLDFTVCAGDNTSIGKGTKVASLSEVGNIEGVNWRRLESRRIIKRGWFRDFEWQPEAVKIVWKEDLDAVISLGYQSFSNAIIRVICRLRGIPLIEWTQGVKRPERGLRWFVRKMYFKWANAFLFYGSNARDFFACHGFRPNQLFVVNNSLDHDNQVVIRQRITSEEIQGCRRQFGLAGPSDRLLFNSCRLEKPKQLHLLVEAVAMLKRQGRNVWCVLIGDGRDRERLQSLARELGAEDRIIFYGACYDERNLGLIISASDLCVMPGDVGLVAMHSLVYGTPLLTCDNSRGIHNPEIETIIEGKTGRYFREGDVADMVVKLNEMLYPQPCKPQMSQSCKDIIDAKYNPRYQEKVVIQALNYCLPPEKRIPMPESGE